jgi:hypothetical protein
MQYSKGWTEWTIPWGNGWIINLWTLITKWENVWNLMICLGDRLMSLSSLIRVFALFCDTSVAEVLAIRMTGMLFTFHLSLFLNFSVSVVLNGWAILSFFSCSWYATMWYLLLIGCVSVYDVLIVYSYETWWIWGICRNGSYVLQLPSE